jgi:hypothetical protein
MRIPRENPKDNGRSYSNINRQRSGKKNGSKSIPK